MSFLFDSIDCKLSLELLRKRFDIRHLLDYSLNRKNQENEDYIKLGVTCRGQLTLSFHRTQGHFFEMVFQDYLLKILTHRGAFTFTQKPFASRRKIISSTP